MNDEITELREANRRANLIIGQQADEAKALQDRVDALSAENVQVELAIISLPTFDADGPGTCADREVKAVTDLRDQLAAALKDKARLDKLEKNENLHVYFEEGDPDVGVFSTWVIDETVGRNPKTWQLIVEKRAFAGSLRETIDELP